MMASVPATPAKTASSDSTHSTPHSRTTAHATTLNTAPVTSLQSELKKDLAHELGGHIWQFSPQRISQMLSPKCLKPGYTNDLITSGQKGPLHPSLDDHICLVDDAAVTSALDGIEVPSSAVKPVDRESQSYQSLCVFLNNCVRAINSAYDRLAQAHPKIGQFVLKPRGERCGSAEPDIVGLHEENFNPKVLPCCWGFSDVKNPQVRIPVEVKKAWPELIWQAGTYARALRSATPERAFRLVFGYNQMTCDFRVLIFHNGGLAAMCMLWPVFLWQDAEDAGFPSFTDGDQIALYRSENDGLARRVASISFSELSRTGDTHLFDPTENETHTLHWSISKDNKSSPKPDRRPMIVCVMKEEGMSLEQCTCALDLSESILHALLGWLAAYERGWLQRDPSIGNILRICQNRVQSWAASIEWKEESEDLTKQLASTHLGPVSPTWDPDRASELEKALVGFGRPQVCKAILTDFDLSAYLQDYFSPNQRAARSLSGTVEFMSVRLRAAFSASEPYLQSPLDDLWAFFYTAVWATLFHARRPRTDVLPISSQEMEWGLQLGSRSAAEREGTIRAIVKVQDFQTQFPPMLPSHGASSQRLALVS
ncbi:hypothetical protein B0H14DRAFT_3479810 [Mycena olivaceomarginata]|nr:hypothetical protein B0H14DRAFT_3479810 [Mycena olivaceomarginata]